MVGGAGGQAGAGITGDPGPDRADLRIGTRQASFALYIEPSFVTAVVHPVQADLRGRGCRGREPGRSGGYGASYNRNTGRIGCSPCTDTTKHLIGNTIGANTIGMI